MDGCCMTSASSSGPAERMNGRACRGGRLCHRGTTNPGHKGMVGLLLRQGKEKTSPLWGERLGGCQAEVGGAKPGDDVGCGVKCGEQIGPVLGQSEGLVAEGGVGREGAARCDPVIAAAAPCPGKAATRAVLVWPLLSRRRRILGSGCGVKAGEATAQRRP